MKDLLTAIAIAFLTISCNTRPEVEKPAEKPKTIGGHFFDFDEVFYYSGSNEITDAIFDKAPTSLKDSISMDILIRDIPVSLKDVTAIAYLDSIGYEKIPVESAKLEALKEIFRDNGLVPMEDTSCLPMYRDIYVFKKQGTIIGIAKICHECEQSHIIGTKINTEGFGSAGEYDQLSKLITAN